LLPPHDVVQEHEHRDHAADDAQHAPVVLVRHDLGRGGGGQERGCGSGRRRAARGAARLARPPSRGWGPVAEAWHSTAALRPQPQSEAPPGPPFPPTTLNLLAALPSMPWVPSMLSACGIGRGGGAAGSGRGSTGGHSPQGRAARAPPALCLLQGFPAPATSLAPLQPAPPCGPGCCAGSRPLTGCRASPAGRGGGVQGRRGASAGARVLRRGGLCRAGGHPHLGPGGAAEPPTPPPLPPLRHSPPPASPAAPPTCLSRPIRSDSASMPRSFSRSSDSTSKPPSL
jgi:hypothetical protein